MSSEKMQMSPEHAQMISNMLQSQGIPQSEINQIINGEYETYKYCDSENYKINKLFYDVVDNTFHEIKIRFNQDYSNFKYQNGNWELKFNGRGALEYKSN